MFVKHLQTALEHVNTMAVWGFIAIVTFVLISGPVDQPHEIALLLGGAFAGGMAGLNFRWAFRELALSHAIVRRNKP